MAIIGAIITGLFGALIGAALARTKPQATATPLRLALDLSKRLVSADSLTKAADWQLTYKGVVTAVGPFFPEPTKEELEANGGERPEFTLEQTRAHLMWATEYKAPPDFKMGVTIANDAGSKRFLVPFSALQVPGFLHGNRVIVLRHRNTFREMIILDYF